MRRTKRLGALLIALVMIFTMLPITTAGAAATSGNIVLTMNSTTFTVNGTSTKIDAEGSKPVQSKGYTMLPLRAIVEATSGSLSYNASTKQITVVRGGDTVVLTLGSKTAKVNGANRTLGAAPYASNNRTYVHIRTLELLGMRVDWEQKTNKITVNFVDPSKVYNLTLQNGMGIAYTGVYIAPQGTAAGAAAESGNLLGADTLNINGNLVVQAPITGTGLYQLRCTYVSQGKTVSNTIQNVNLTGITDRATILMNSTTAPTVTVDGTALGNSAITIYFKNSTGNAISGLWMKQTTATDWGGNLISGSLVSGGQTAVNYTYNTTSPYYDIYVQYTSGATNVYNRVTVGATGALKQQVIELGPNGILSGSTTETVKTKVTFENNSDDDIKGVIFSTSDMTESKWEKADTTFGKISSDKEKSTEIDLSDSRRWYVCVLDEDGDYLESERLDFESTSVKSLTITWDGDELDVDDINTTSDDKDDSEGYGGNTDFVLANTSDTKFEDVVVITQEDYEKLEDKNQEDEYKKIANKGISLGSLKGNTIKAYEDVFKYKEEDYHLVLVTDKSEDEFKVLDIEGLDKDSKFVVALVDEDSIIDWYDADDDEGLLWITNKDNEDLTITDDDDNSYTDIKSCDDSDYQYVQIGDDSAKITIENEDDDEKTTKKLSSYDYNVVIVKVTSKSVSVSSI